MAATDTATLECDGDYCQLEILDQIPTENIPIMDDFDYSSNNPNPATTTSSETFIKSLEIVTTPAILTKLLQTSSCCSICTDDFAVDENLTELPYCWHWFHHDCILPWLQRNNTCPLCRHELFHDDRDKMDDIDIEEVEIEDILMEMLEEGLNERDISRSMETDSSEELRHQQTIDILSELLDESRDNNNGQNQQLSSNLSEPVD